MPNQPCYLMLPDCLLVLWMAIVLYRLREKRDLEFLNLWVLGLLLILVEEVARMFYLSAPSLLVHRFTHTLMLNAYILAGSAFFHSALGKTRLRTTRRIYLALCALPFPIVMTAYGLDFYSRPFFIAVTVFGLLFSAAVATWQRRGIRDYLVHIAIWAPSIFFAYQSLFRHATYYLLFAIFTGIAIGFYVTLPKKRWGRTITITGFASWALCFITHPYLKQGPYIWAILAKRVWDMEMFVVTFGLLILTLEELSAAHEHDALHDALTGLPNRRLFVDRIEQALARARRTRSRAILLNFDLNGFKMVNDTWGHEAGDFLLKEVANRLRSVTRETDTLCRVGGDEFFLLVSDVAMNEERDALPYSALGEEIRHRVETEPYIYHGNGIETPIYASVSIGYAVFPDDASDSEHLCRIADRKMYGDKNSHKKQKDTKHHSECSPK